MMEPKLTHLVQDDVDVLVLDGIHEVLAVDALTPVTTGTAHAHALGEPQALVY